MQVSPEEEEGIRELLAALREVAEDFNTVFCNRVVAVAPKSRLLILAAVSDDGEALVGGLAAHVALLDKPDELAALLTVIDETNASQGSTADEYDLMAGCFGWAAERCLGDGYTSKIRAGHAKLRMITRAAALLPRTS